MPLIHIDQLIKHNQNLQRPPGLGRALRDLFSGDYRYLKDGVGKNESFH